MPSPIDAGDITSAIALLKAWAAKPKDYQAIALLLDGDADELRSLIGALCQCNVALLMLGGVADAAVPAVLNDIQQGAIASLDGLQ